MNVEPLLDESYLTWLYSQVGSVKLKNRSRTYWSLLKKLYTTEFVWFVPNDDNRVEDGRDLRYEFINEYELDDVDQNWLELGCSMLEMMIGLSRRLAFEAEGEPRDWFWHLIKNLGLDIYTDRHPLPQDEVDEILSRVIWRTYSSDGTGGLFPLRTPSNDQRNVELWYQLNEYILERT